MATKIKSVKVIQDPENSLRDVVLLQKTIQEVSDYAKKLNNSGLKQRAIVVLLQDAIGGAKISKTQIVDVLEAAEELGKMYLK